MTRALPRTNFNSSGLIRFLADLALVDTPEAGHAFAEQLGLWLDFTDAISLFAAHNASGATPGQSSAPVALAEDFARARTALANTIIRSCSPLAGETRIKLPTPQSGLPIEIAAAYEPYRRFYLAHQRDMELNLRPLRAKAREALSLASAPLQKLAALDGALDEVLAERESKLLATVPGLLEKRFEQLRQAHLQALQEGQPVGEQVEQQAEQQADDPALWLQAGGWLAKFCQEMQGLLLAELDLRLQPTVGLIEAFSNEVAKLK